MIKEKYMRFKVVPFLVFIANSLLAQVTMEFRINTYPDTKTFEGKLVLCNNTGSTLLGGYEIQCVWPSVETVDYGVSLLSSGSESCDSIILKTESWDMVSNGGCKSIDVGGDYNPPMFLPPKGVGNQVHAVVLKHSASSYKPEAVDAAPAAEEFYFKRECFIPTASEIHLGEATLYEWGSTIDVFIPDNKKKWALANAHAHTLFTNMAGAEIVSINHYNASSLNESRCGCESDIVNDPSATNLLSYQASTVNDGCFQISSNGWAQLNQFYPEMLKGLSFSNVVTGNYARGCILKAYYDMTTLLYWEKAQCLNPVQAFQETNDPYFAEEVLGMAFYQGFNQELFTTIFQSDRSTYLTSENIVKDLGTNTSGNNGILGYGARIRNSTKQLDNNVAATWVTNSATYKPSIFNWKGWYDDLISLSDINAYLEEIKPMFSGVNWVSVADAIEIKFNQLNEGAAVPFSQLGPVIDELVLSLPAYDGNRGMSAVYHSEIIACSATAISLSSCSELCPGETGEITVNLMGTAPFDFTVTTPNNGNITTNNVSNSVYTLEVTGPGEYQVFSYNDAVNSAALNCLVTSVVIPEADPENCLSVGVEEVGIDVKIYPNPTDGIVNIIVDGLAGEALVAIYDLAGKKVRTAKIIANKEINLLIEEPRGIYFVELITQSGFKETIKLLKM